MASLIKFLASWFTSVRAPSPETSFLTYLDILFEEDLPKFYERKDSHGTITKVTDSYCLIDHTVFVDNSIIRNIRRPNVNDQVTYSAIRRNEFETWRAGSIQPFYPNQWEDGSASRDVYPTLDDDTEQKFIIPAGYLQKSSIGKIIQIEDTHVYVDTDEILFDSTLVQCIFPPAVGDWLALQVCYDPNNLAAKPTCLQAKPLRTWKYEGRVTKLDRDSGVINHEIFFSFSLVPANLVLQEGDRAEFTAVESNADEFSWRAVQLRFPFSKVAAIKPATISTLPDELFENKNGVKLANEFKFTLSSPGEVMEERIAIGNEDFSKTLHKGTFHADGVSQLEIIFPTLPCTVNEKSVTWLKVRCVAKQVGASREVMVLDFGEFKIGRYVSIHVQETQTSQANGNGSSAQYEKHKWVLREDEDFGEDRRFVLPGQRKFKPAPFAPVKLPLYTVPKFVWNAMARKKADLTPLYPCLNEPLMLSNYIERFRILLHLEEIETTFRLRDFDIERATLSHVGPYLALDVPGLAEKRPSIMVGDAVILSTPYGNSGARFEGFVHETRQTQVLFKFHPDFHARYSGEDYHVTFQLNRTPLRRCHLAVDLAVQHLGPEVLFPSKLTLRPPQIPTLQSENLEHEKAPTKLTVAQRLFGSNFSLDDSFEKETDLSNNSITWINELLNREQKLAVLRILNGQSRPLPYIIYGPPGTGKTVTVVEAILQLFLLMQESRILVCTPSNSSADLIVERLHLSQKILPGDVARLNAYHRSVESLPEAVKPYAMTGENLEKVVRHRIVVTTCTTAGTIAMLRLRHGHFSHVIIDEAGQATEAESLIPLTLIRAERENPDTKVVPKGGQIVLAGDPKQLGPVLLSRYAAAYGLDLSLLERLSLLPLYFRNDPLYPGGYNPHLITKLVRNYRSHPDLVLLPSELFYDNELVAYGTSEPNWLNGLDLLPEKRTPLLFHGVRGENLQDVDSPSWYNPAETYQTVRYLQAVLNTGVNVAEVGIITPYRKQVQKIRDLMVTFGLERVKVGSVEEFQGQEREVIIVSTVRSSSELVAGDLVHSLGFVKSPKRFNVTITRAKSLLIVVGNPHLLVQDQYWGKFLQLCVQKRAYVGCDLPAELSTFRNEL